MNRKMVALIICLAVCFPLCRTPLDSCYATINCDYPIQQEWISNPIFTSYSVKPRILLLFSNDHTNFYKGYNDDSHAVYNDDKEYYGYFDPKKEYEYNGTPGTTSAAANDYFVPVAYMDYNNNHRVTANDRWSGNFLNWLTMCHADFVRKALMGGRRIVDTPNLVVLERGNIPDSSHSWTRTVDIDTAALYTPFSRSSLGVTATQSATVQFSNLDTTLTVKKVVGSGIEIDKSAGPASKGTALASLAKSFVSRHSSSSGISPDKKPPPPTPPPSTTTPPPVTTTLPPAYSCMTGGTCKFHVAVSVCDPTVGVEDNAQEYKDTNGSPIYKPEGLIQQFSDKAYFGLMTYSGCKTDRGGIMRVNMKMINEGNQPEINPTGNITPNSDGIIQFLNDFEQKGWDPVGEMYYEAVKYFKSLLSTPEYYNCGNNDLGFKALYDSSATSRGWEDPMLQYCQKNFVIIINDEYPSKDSNDLPGSSWPSGVSNAISDLNVRDWTNRVGNLEQISAKGALKVGNVLGGTQDNSCTAKNVANLGDVRGICPSEPEHEGSFYVGGLAYYAHITDLRSETGFTGSSQTLTTYAIAFRASSGTYQVPPPPLNQLYLATKYGGFDDRNGNGLPDTGEWEGDTETITVDGASVQVTWPKNFAHAEGGKDFESAMLRILTDIMRKATSGTAAALVTSSQSGIGQLYQAYFKPYDTDGTNEIRWAGFLNALWVDAYGNLREDTNHDGLLDLTVDKIIEIQYDSAAQNTYIYRYSDANGDNVRDTSSAEETVDLTKIKPIWNATEVLGVRTAERKIWTFLDKDNDETVGSGEFLQFTTGTTAGAASLSDLLPFLQVDSSEASDFVDYINAIDSTGNKTTAWNNRGWRSRAMTVKDGTTGLSTTKKYLLGDIVHSSPTPQAQPMEIYDLIYGDSTYNTYYNAYSNRATYVYAGANDGMLHCFYGGVYKSGDYSGTANSVEVAYIDNQGRTLGEEVWAFIPQNVLPHLRWLACEEYSHMYYVDAKPKVIDARIFQDSWENESTATDKHIKGWGTVLVGGMGFGGSPITVSGSFGGGSSSSRTFKSSYFAIDITDPENPVLLWEKVFDDMDFTTSYPSVVRVQKAKDDGTYDKPSDVAYADQKWLLVLGNGPVDFEGNPASGRTGTVYVVDLYTGEVVRTLTTGNTGEFMASAAGVDLGINYDVDAFYIGSSLQTGTATNSVEKTDCSNIPSCGVFGGKMYRVTTVGSGSRPDFNPANWTLSTLFDAGKPVTGAPGLAGVADTSGNYKVDSSGNIVYSATGTNKKTSDPNETPLDTSGMLVDSYGRIYNLWLYFGTGRFYGECDKYNTDQQSFFGVKEPCTSQYGSSCTTTVASADLLNVTNVNVYEDGNSTYVEGLASGTGWSDLVSSVEYQKGFMLNLTVPTTTSTFGSGNKTCILDNPSERVMVKPAIVGGLVIFTSFTPTLDECSFGGGTSELYALYAQTGTAYKENILGTEQKEVTTGGTTKTMTKIKSSVDLGVGMPSQVAVHLGEEDGSVVFTQESTGAIFQQQTGLAQSVRDGVVFWREINN